MTTRGSRLRPTAVLFGIMAAHAVLETARDALFLTRLGPDRLAWAYLAIAVAALGAVMALRRWGGTRDPRRMLIAFLAIATAGTGLLAAMLAFAPSIHAGVFVLYVWTGVVATLVVPAFWLAIDASLRLADAKQMFATLGAGGVLGALVGSAFATVLARAVASPHLVSASAIGFAAATALAVWLVPPAQPAPRTRPHRDPVRTTRLTLRYLRLLLAVGLISTVTLTLGDLVFKRMVAERLADHDLGVVFGATYSALNLVGLAIQLAVTPRLLERLGVGGASTVLPLIVLATALGFVLTGALIAVLALKLADGGLRHSVHRVASEILFLPLSAAARDAGKPVIEAIGQRGGQAAAALLAFALAGGRAETWLLGIATAVAAVLWLAAIAVTRGAYVQLFQDTLDAGDIQRDARIPTLDASAVNMLTATLSSPDESEAAAALDLLARRGHKVPALVLYHPSPAIVRRALSYLEGDVRDDVARVLGHLVTHPDPHIRASALAASSRTGCHVDRLAGALSDPEPDVRAAAIVGLLTCSRAEAHGPAAQAAARAQLAVMLAGTTDDRVALAHAIGREPRDEFREVLDELLADRTTETAVLREVLEVWERAPQLADGERLLQLLEDPHLRGHARRVFVAAGDRFFDRLLAALDDSRTPLGVRRHLPRTISRFHAPDAAAALVARLVREPDGTTEFKILRALGRMRADDPRLAIDLEPLEQYVRRSIADVERYARLGDDVAAQLAGAEPQPALSLLADLLAEKRRHAIERVFRALGIIHAGVDLRSVHDALTGDDDHRRSAAREILEGLVPAAIRLPLLAALSPAPTIQVVERPVARAAEDIARALLADPSDSLRCIAAHFVAERRLVALRPELARLRHYAISPLVGEAFDQAIARLDA